MKVLKPNRIDVEYRNYMNCMNDELDLTHGKVPNYAAIKAPSELY